MQRAAERSWSRTITFNMAMLVAMGSLLPLPLWAQDEVRGSGQVDGGAATEGVVSHEAFPRLLAADRAGFFQALTKIENGWHAGNTAMLLETMRLLRDPVRAESLVRVLQEKTGENFGVEPERWFRSIWHDDYQPHPHYGQFKKKLYARIDPRFAEYFSDERPATIRLDEIRWGGVRRDGIPPLKNPKMISADEADYLDDSDVVFGVYLGGQAKAYPKRILAWHEMVKDTVGKTPIHGVYCTLCGSMIVYDSVHEGQTYELGTSGFLYRSNKLMYDHRTKSLWSTLKGEPVVGPLVGKGIQLKRYSVVTTNWGTWRKKHPRTTVLSLQTGYRRDYREGAAYRNYFATDRLMFSVPDMDSRLLNKEEVIALRWGDQQLAISTKFLAQRPLYEGQFAGHSFVILTDASGASRVYDSTNVQWKAFDAPDSVTDSKGEQWQVGELQLTGPNGRQLPRLPQHRAFWFGWVSAFPDTTLIQ